MKSDHFAIGVLAGVLLASGIVFASSYASVPTRSAATLLNTMVTASTTTVSKTSSSQSLAPVTAPTTTTTTSCACATFYVSNASGSSSSAQAIALEPPSSLGRVLSQPAQSLLLLAPVAVALLLGFIFYRSSVPGD